MVKTAVLVVMLMEVPRNIVFSGFSNLTGVIRTLIAYMQYLNMIYFHR